MAKWANLGKSPEARSEEVRGSGKQELSALCFVKTVVTEEMPSVSLLRLAALLSCLWACVRANGVLTDLQWTLTNQNRSISLPCKVPAHALGVLHAAGLVDDPLLYRYNELETRWVALETWNFTTLFSADDALLEHTDIVLMLKGVDTFGDVILNGQHIVATDNYHRQYSMPVKEHMRDGANTLSIILQPALLVAARAKRMHPYTIPTLAAPGAFDLYNFARKPAFDFGWDWGPAFIASGIHGPVQLLAFSEASLQAVHMHQQHVDGTFVLGVESELLVPQRGAEGVLTISIQGLQVHKQVPASLTEPGLQQITTTLNIDASQVQLWWPVGYGQQPLYQLLVTYQPQGATCGQHCPGLKFNSTTAACASSNSNMDNGAGTGSTQVASNSTSSASSAGDCSTASGCPTQLQQPLKDAASGNPRCSTAQRRVGFRTVELVRQPLQAAAQELLGSFPGWQDPMAAQQGQAGPVWPDAKQQDGQWGQVEGRWQFIANPLNLTQQAADFAYPHSGPQLLGQPGEEVLDVGAAPAGNHSAAEGESFYFRINGLPLYAKGANLIPFDILSTNVTAHTINTTLRAALASHMNMVRVWGGGEYQADGVYDFCDEHGLLVWQETMFACAPYPRDEAFLATVAEEVRQQVRRLSHHPSVVLWGGNNEVEASFKWYNQTRSNLALYALDYAELFLNTIHHTVQEVAPGAIFLDSSPSNGLISAQPYIKRWGNPQDARYGDVHFYNYSADCKDFRTYPQAKFVSEYGWQSYPTWDTYAAATAPEDWAVGALMTEFRQRHPNGTAELLAQFSRHFALPDSWEHPEPQQQAALFKSFLYLGHMQQLLCYEAALGYWRRLRSQPQALTMGVLYWQLNDVWAGASWSGRDYGGRWKALQYGIRRQFAPVAVQLVEDGPQVQVFIVNDLTTPFTISLDVQLHALDDTPAACNSTAPLASLQHTATVPALNAARVWAQELAALLQLAPNCQRTSCYLTVSTTNASSTSSTGSSSSIFGNGTASVLQPGSSDSSSSASTIATSSWTTQAHLFLAPYKHMTLHDPAISFSNFTQLSDTHISFTVRCERPALLVLLQAPVHGHFSDNALTLHPCQPRSITFHSEQGAMATSDLAAVLGAVSLWDHSFKQPQPSVAAAGQEGAQQQGEAAAAGEMATEGTLVFEGPPGQAAGQAAAETGMLQDMLVAQAAVTDLA